MNGKSLLLATLTLSLFASSLAFAQSPPLDKKEMKALSAALNVCIQKAPKVKGFPDKAAISECLQEKKEAAASMPVPAVKSGIVKAGEKPARPKP